MAARESSTVVTDLIVIRTGRKLTKREADVFARRVLRVPFAEIGQELGMAEKTAQSHLRTARCKLQLPKDWTELRFLARPGPNAVSRP